MNYSDTKTLSYKIADALYKHGPKPSSEIVAMFSDVRENSVKTMIGRMCFEGDLENEAGKIQLKSHVRRHFAEKYCDKNEIAAPRTAFEQKPLQAKNIPSLNPLIAGKLRDIGFKTSGTSFVPAA